MAIFSNIAEKGTINKLIKATGDTRKQRYLSYLIFQKKKVF